MKLVLGNFKTIGLPIDHQFSICTIVVLNLSNNQMSPIYLSTYSYQSYAICHVHKSLPYC